MKKLEPPVGIEPNASWLLFEHPNPLDHRDSLLIHPFILSLIQVI